MRLPKTMQARAVRVAVGGTCHDCEEGDNLSEKQPWDPSRQAH